jgi:hypothetical protein
LPFVAPPLSAALPFVLIVVDKYQVGL